MYASIFNIIYFIVRWFVRIRNYISRIFFSFLEYINFSVLSVVTHSGKNKTRRYYRWRVNPAGSLNYGMTNDDSLDECSKVKYMFNNKIYSIVFSDKAHDISILYEYFANYLKYIRTENNIDAVDKIKRNVVKIAVVIDEDETVDIRDDILSSLPLINRDERGKYEKMEITTAVKDLVPLIYHSKPMTIQRLGYPKQTFNWDEIKELCFMTLLE